MASEALQDIGAKLRGAEDRLNELKSRLDQGAATDLLTIRTDRDREGRVRVRAKEIADVPQEWHVWIGECVHDMRSALDHLAYALNVAGGGSDPPSNWNRSAFPIHAHRRGFREMARKAHGRRPDECPIRHFPRGARNRVEQLQPYHRRTNLDSGWLGVLTSLSNIDKHHHFPVALTVPWLVAWPATVEGHAVVAAKALTDRPLKPGGTFVWLEVPSLPPDVRQPYVELGYACNLHFARNAAQLPVPLVLPYEQVGFVLGSTLAHIQTTVLPALAPYLL